MKRKILLAFCAVVFPFVLPAAPVLWNEAINGTLDEYPYAPTNSTFVIHSIGTATDSVNYVEGHVTDTPLGEYNWYNSTGDGFFFAIPPDRVFSGLQLTQSSDFPAYAWGGLYASATGPYDGAGNLGIWLADQLSVTNDLFAKLGITSLPGGIYSVNVYPLLNDYNWPTVGTITYTLAILTSAIPPTLQITNSAGQAAIIWNTNNATGFTLQCTPNLTPPVTWTVVTNTSALVGGQMVVTNLTSSGSRFFRLIGPNN